MGQQQPIEPPPPPPATTPQPQPQPRATRVLPYILTKHEIKATRAELVALALCVLIVVGQLCRIVWSLWRRGAFVTTQQQEQQQQQEEVTEKRNKEVAIVLPVEPDQATPADILLESLAVLASSSAGDGDGGPTLRFRLRRRSSWGGRPGHVRLDNSDTQDRRRSAGPLGGLQEGGGDEGGDDDAREGEGSGAAAGHDALAAALEGLGSLGPEPATPTLLPLSVAGASDSNGVSGDDEEITEPRSPRVLAADQAAMMGALLNAQEDQEVDWKAERPSPVVGAEVDVPSLAIGFEDPLGVNRLAGSSDADEDEEGYEAVELEARDGGRRDV